MRSELLINAWIGAALTIVGAVSTIWLTVTGKLTLYVHPRYTAFTLVLAVVGAVIVVAAVVVRRGTSGGETEHAHEHEHEHEQRAFAPPRHAPPGLTAPGLTAPRLRDRALTWSKAVLLVLAAVALLVVPPATLSATMRQSRELTTSGQALDSTDTSVLAGGNSSLFSVKDWAALLRQGGPQAVLGKPVDVSGYVLDQKDDDVFYVVRMMVSCCAVDAQPIGVPVYRPGWREEFRPSDWVAVTGAFAENPDRESQYATVVRVDSLRKIDEPAQPYVF